MEHRPLGRTGADVSVVGLGTWQLGGDWGDVGDEDAAGVLAAALDAGVTLLDTADVYGDGRSEQRIRDALDGRAERPFVATKAGRRADPFEAEQYTPENLRAWVDRSRRNLGVDTLDLVQLHCPPPAVYSDQRVYDTLDRLVEEQAIAAYGVSVETVAEGLTALEHPGVQTIQVILNIFRRKPPASTTSPRPSPPTTTGATTATVRPSTSARPSRACPSTSVSPPPARWPRSPATRRPRPSPCGG
jgi:aryl-alcohol dehydrogenase-like predicted oxidoreductase